MPEWLFGIEFEAEEVGIARQSVCRLGVDRPSREDGMLSILRGLASVPCFPPRPHSHVALAANFLGGCNPSCFEPPPPEYAPVIIVSPKSQYAARPAGSSSTGPHKAARCTVTSAGVLQDMAAL